MTFYSKKSSDTSDTSPSPHADLDLHYKHHVAMLTNATTLSFAKVTCNDAETAALLVAELERIKVAMKSKTLFPEFFVVIVAAFLDRGFELSPFGVPPTGSMTAHSFLFIRRPKSLGK